MKLRNPAFLFLTLILVSCNHVYREYEKEPFATYSWDEGEEVKFTPTIDDTSKVYKLKLGLRHVYGFRLQNLDVVVKIIAPSGKVTKASYQLAVRTNRDTYVGSCAGDLCDLETEVNDNLRFTETGLHTFIITHNAPVDKVVGVLGFGLIID